LTIVNIIGGHAAAATDTDIGGGESFGSASGTTAFGPPAFGSAAVASAAGKTAG
jgi:hypothetical protein